MFICDIFYCFLLQWSFHSHFIIPVCEVVYVSPCCLSHCHSVTIETQTQQKLKGIKVFSPSSRTGLLRLPLCKNTLKWNRQKLKKESLDLSKNRDSLCLLFLQSLLLHLCNVNKIQMSLFLSLSKAFMPHLIAVAPNNGELLSSLTVFSCCHGASSSLLISPGALLRPSVHINRSLHVRCSLNCCHTDSCC